MTDFLAALALAIVIEGTLYAAFPQQMQAMLERVLARPASTLRAGGVACAALGLLLLWIVRG